MGCFDFIYADNGRNIRGQNGFIYLTDELCHQTGLKSPLRFVSTDEYGRFDIKVPRAEKVVTIDIYALYAAMLYLEGVWDPDKNPNAKPLKPEEKGAMESYLDQLTLIQIKHGDISQDIETEITETEDYIRCKGIDYFFKHLKTLSTNQTHVVHSLGNQRRKNVTVSSHFTGDVPLVITRKKLPTNQNKEPFAITVKNWGFVTDSDPNQGFSPTNDQYTIWEPRT